MRFKIRDVIATVLVAAVVVPYIGYLVRGEMPFIKDPRGMSATGLVLGTVAYLVMRQGDALDRVTWTENGFAVITFGLGIAALVLAESGVAEVLLAVFMGALVLLWLAELTDHAGLMPGHARPVH